MNTLFCCWKKTPGKSGFYYFRLLPFPFHRSPFVNIFERDKSFNFFKPQKTTDVVKARQREGEWLLVFASMFANFFTTTKNAKGNFFPSSFELFLTYFIFESKTSSSEANYSRKIFLSLVWVNGEKAFDLINFFRIKLLNLPYETIISGVS